MTQRLAFVAALVFVPSLAPAQTQILKVATADGGVLPADPAWTGELTREDTRLIDYFAIGSKPADNNTTIVLMAHTSVDLSSSAPHIEINQGLVELYPCIKPSSGAWTLGGSMFSNLIGPVILDPATTQLVIPPHRVRACIDTLLASQSAVHGHVANPSQTNDPVPFIAPTWPTSLLNLDERTSFAGTWNAPRNAVNMVDLGRRALSVAIHRETGGVPPGDGLAALQDYLDQDLGFVIHLQAMYVTGLASGEPKIKFSYGAKVHRLSLRQQYPTDPWFGVFGARRRIVSVTNQNHLITMGLRGSWSEVELIGVLPLPRDGYRIHIPVNTGYVTVSPLPYVPLGGCPERLRFDVPIEAVPGFVFVDHVETPGQMVPPVGAYPVAPGLWGVQFFAYMGVR